MMRPWLFGVLFAISMILFDSLLAENITNSSDYLKMSENSFRDKHHRLITFNTDENSDISIELSFNVPFVKIPIKKTMDTTKGALANVNVGAIVLSGATFLMTTFIAPFISYLLAKKKNNDGKQRREDFAQWTDLFKDVDLLLAKNNLHSTSCLQRIVCSMVKNASLKLVKGSATSGEKIVDGIATSEWFRGLIANTFLESAVRNGLNNASCSKRYNKCKIGQRNVEMILKQLLKKFFDRDT